MTDGLLAWMDGRMLLAGRPCDIALPIELMAQILDHPLISSNPNNNHRATPSSSSVIAAIIG